MAKRKLPELPVDLDKLKEMAEERVGQVVQGMIASSQMEDRATYLRRGRAYQNLPTELLMEKWAEAFRLLVESRTPEISCLFDDTSAELDIRGVEPDMSRVKEAQTKLIGEIERDRALNPEGHPTIRSAIEGYMKRLDEDMQ